MLRHTLTVTALCSLLSGCMFYQSYPDTWAKPDYANSGCDALTGRYAAQGESADRDLPSGASLPGLLRQPTLSQADQIDLHYADGRLRMTGYLQDTQQWEIAFSRADGTLACGSGGAMLKSDFGMAEGQGNPLVGVVSSSLRVQRAADGALVATQSEHAAGLVFMFLPVVAGESRLYRFAAVR
ncbi:MAG: hypothetical protein ACK4Z4_11725 [Ferrovibrio sp.]